MKYLLVSDIHGSLPALEKVLDFYDRERCGMLCILGDILNYGPRNSLPGGLDPKAIAERLNRRAQDIVAIRGNCDSEVDRCFSVFPFSPTISCSSTRANGFSSPTDTYITRRRCRRTIRCHSLRAYASLGNDTAGGDACLQHRVCNLPQGGQRADVYDLRGRGLYGL